MDWYRILDAGWMLRNPVSVAAVTASLKALDTVYLHAMFDYVQRVMPWFGIVRCYKKT